MRYERLWTRVIDVVREQPPGVDVVFAKAPLPHPLRAGFRFGIGIPRGTVAHYRLALADGSGLHVREYRDRFDVHWDRHDPGANPVRHLLDDAPQVPLAALCLVGMTLVARRVRRSAGARLLRMRR